MRRYVLLILASLAAAAAAGCGSDGPSGGIPETRADSLRREIKDVGEAVEGGRCDDVSGQLTQVDERLDNLPPSVDDQLRQSLRDGIDRLRSTAQQDCTEQGLQEEAATTDNQPVEPPVETQTDTTETEPPPPTDTDTTETEPPVEVPTDTGETEPPAEVPTETGETQPPSDDSGGSSGGQEEDEG